MDKQTRLEHYKTLLYAFKKNHEETYDNGFCWVFKTLIGNNVYDEQFQIKYPELYSQKPENNNGFYWWSTKNHKPRIEALKKAIELCK